jgi:hypothetical protein
MRESLLKMSEKIGEKLVVTVGGEGRRVFPGSSAQNDAKFQLRSCCSWGGYILQAKCHLGISCILKTYFTSAIWWHPILRMAWALQTGSFMCNIRESSCVNCDAGIPEIARLLPCEFFELDITSFVDALV